MMAAVAALSRRFELASEVARGPATAETRRRGVRIGNLLLLVAHDSGGELLDDVRIYALSRTAAWCRGLINLRGNLVPAFDLHEHLGLARLRSARQWWLVLGRNETAIAFAVDALPVLLNAAIPAVLQASVVPEPLRAFVSGSYRIDGELWLDLDHCGYFNSLAQTAAA